MEIELSEDARQEFLSLDSELKRRFKAHMEKLIRMPPRRHLKFGVPYHVEDVTQQARLVYKCDGKVLYVVRCFARHKDYEKWYASYK